MPAKPKEWIFDYAMCGGHNGSHYLVHPLNKSWFSTKDCTKEQLAAICAHHYVSIPPNAVFKDYAEALETRAMDRYKTMNLEPIKNALRSRRLPYSGLNKPGLQERLLNDIAEHKYDGWETYHLMKEVEKRGGTDPTGMTADELKEWLKQNDWAIAQAQGPKGTPGSPISAPESPDTQRWNSRNRIFSSWDPEELRRQRKEMRIDYLGRNRKLLEALIMGYMVDKGELRKRPDSANLTKRLREVLEDSELEQLSDTGLKILLKYAGVLAWNLDKPRDVLLLMSRNDGRWVLSTYTPNFDAEGSSDDDHESEPNAIEPVPEAEGFIWEYSENNETPPILMRDPNFSNGPLPKWPRGGYLSPPPSWKWKDGFPDGNNKNLAKKNKKGGGGKKPTVTKPTTSTGTSRRQ